eukprot:1185683-Prorocentrum_minimum.AAC.8
MAHPRVFVLLDGMFDDEVHRLAHTRLPLDAIARLRLQPGHKVLCNLLLHGVVEVALVVQLVEHVADEPCEVAAGEGLRGDLLAHLLLPLQAVTLLMWEKAPISQTVSMGLGSLKKKVDCNGKQNIAQYTDNETTCGALC